MEEKLINEAISHGAAMGQTIERKLVEMDIRAVTLEHAGGGRLTCHWPPLVD